MKKSLRTIALACGLAAAGVASAEVTLYEHDGFRGRSVTVDRQMRNLERRGFNDEISSVVVRNGTWELCEHARFEGRCVTVGPGNYPSLASVGLNDRVSSVRPIDQYGSYERRNERGNAYAGWRDREQYERFWDRDRNMWVERWYDRDRGQWVERY